MSEEICYASATELAERIRVKELSPVEVVQAHLDRIEAINPKINAVVTLAPGSLERARQAEAAIIRGEVWGPLHGVPFTVKDYAASLLCGYLPQPIPSQITFEGSTIP